MTGEKKIVLISSGQPSLNPRLVKEADALSDAGWEVVVLYSRWNDWGTRADATLLPKKKWKAQLVGGSPESKKAVWLLSRLCFKISRLLLQKINYSGWLADIAIARSSWLLARAAKRQPATLYIAHNLGALPAAARAAAKFNKPYSFDAEDFHRQEISDDTQSFHYRLCSLIEDRYLPGAAFVTAAGPLMAAEYERVYRRPVTSIMNVFPKTNMAPAMCDSSAPLKLFWFSQTVGPNRGLENVIGGIKMAAVPVELHLLGLPAQGYTESLLKIAGEIHVVFHPPVEPDRIFETAANFDIGIAAEPGFCLNNRIALSNKIFTYLLSGLAVVASDTPAQLAFMQQHQQIGKIYRSKQELADVIRLFYKDRFFLAETKQSALRIGMELLNWETESREFLKLVNDATDNE